MATNGLTTTGELEKRTIAKLRWRIIPFVMLLYFIAYLDRVNIGFAALTMNADIGLSSAAFGFGAGIFFVGYFIFEVPSNLILHKVGARRWIARIMVTWGVVSMAMALVQGETSFYILRFLLGVAEAGFFPGIILYLSYWFPARHRASMTALFMAAVPLSVALGSPISGALLELDGLLGLKGWQWMFLLEGAPAIILAWFVLKYLTDRPDRADWLNDDEREWLLAEMAEEARNTKPAHDWREGLTALKNPRVLALSLVYFGTSAGLYTLSIWSPQMIAQFGTTPLMTGLFNAVPAIFAVIAMILWSMHSDKTGERNWHVVIACLVAAGGLILAAYASSLMAVLLALVIVNVGVSSAKPPLWSMPTMFLGGAAAAAGIATINSIGNLGGFFGPYIIGWVLEVTSSYKGGLFAVAALLVLSSILVLVLARTGLSKTKNASSNGEHHA
ncbi:MFS transporter [Aurantiacibacter xanthus]|uniref:Putative tartrate transporter n=1 Tax=Aurantiacibacter xanthus TaxID=1784712 RepID=A0A3A1NYC8_9SPHN|nr:MFS transporter [Aurantiacibacter xanthus]RIV80144.1 MFS transporter [Aurantiacibacter xanthus]